MNRVSLCEIERVINNIKQNDEASVVDGCIIPELSLLADVYGAMIYFNQSFIAISAVPLETVTVLRRFGVAC